MPNFLQIREFPVCCAGGVISQFGGTHAARVSRGLIREQIVHDLKEIAQWWHYKFYTVTLNTDQALPRSICKEFGFRTVQKFPSAHGGEVYFMIVDGKTFKERASKL